MSMSNISYRSAIRFALREEMQRDERVFLMGEDIAEAGGVFKVTDGLLSEFGAKRVIDTPISETAFVGAALGASLTGLTPVVELMFSDFTAVAMDQIANQIAKKAYLSRGQEHISLVIRAVSGGGISFGPQHSQSLEAWFAHTPGLISLMPADPRDAKGLLKTAIRSGKPVMFFEHKALYPTEGPVPEYEELIPIGKSEIRTEGNDLTIVGAGSTTSICTDCATKLGSKGVNAEVINLRTLAPLDSKTILESVEKTGRIVIVEDDVGFCGWGAEIAAQIADQAIFNLKAPIKRVSAPYSPIPFSPQLEKAYLPSVDSVYRVAETLMR